MQRSREGLIPGTSGIRSVGRLGIFREAGAGSRANISPEDAGHSMWLSTLFFEATVLVMSCARCSRQFLDAQWSGSIGRWGAGARKARARKCATVSDAN